MDANHNDYVPISCEFHDKLEDLATLRQPAAVSYLDDNGTPQQRTAVIKDVYAKTGVEYLALSSGETIRLDRLVDVAASR